MDKKKCDEWAQERLSPTPKNPLTNRKIKFNGPKYKELDKECNDLIVDINSVCMKWLKDNHNDLYLKLKKKQQRKSVSPKVKAKPSPADEPKHDKGPKGPKGPKKKDLQVPIPPVISNDGLRPQTIDLLTDDLDQPQLFYSVDERKGYGETIKNYFSSVIIAEGKACMTQNKTLLKYVDNPKLLGYGSFGNVYGVSIPNTNPQVSAAIKEGRISPNELRKAMVKQYPVEYLFNKLINDLINEKMCPNFSYTFAIFFCDKCILNEFDVKPIHTQCSETVVELFDFTLDKLKDLRDEVILSILFQVLFAIAAIQTEYGLFHNDIKKENILIKVIPSGGYWEYNLSGRTYYVPNYGYIAALNDFGVSLSFKPGISNKDYGRRQAEVIRDPNNDTFLFKPFTTKYYPNVSKSGTVSKIKSHSLGGKGLGLTWNHFYKNFDSEPSISVDLDDMSRFPVYYFHYDIIDAIFMIIGGKRTLQPGSHLAMKVSTTIKKLLGDFYMVKPNQAWPLDRVDLFLAQYTIRKLFSTYYSNFDLEGPLIDSYYLHGST